MAYFDDDVEENFPTTAIDYPVWSEEPAPERDLYIHMVVNKLEPSHIPTPLQEPIDEPINQEEPMESMDSDIPDLINVPKEVLFQEYILPPSIWNDSDGAG